ncbi:MAG: hypothetical protein ACYC6H_10760 [Bellilinea sp.]
MVKQPSKSWKPLLVITLLASLLLQGQSNPLGTTIYFPIVFKNAPTPLYATSYYIQNADPALMYTLGCNLGTRDATTPGQQDSLVVLDFAQMWIENGEYGALGFRGPNNNYEWPFFNFDEIKLASKSFANGYWVCSANDKISNLTLAVGTNSVGSFNQSDKSQGNRHEVASVFGAKWADMVKELNTCGVNEFYCSQVLFTGAIDIEWSLEKINDIYIWNTPYVTRGWVDAFDMNDLNQSIFFNYGACVGCPIVPNLSWKYSTAMPWTQADAWYVSWGSKPAYAVPEIYDNDNMYLLANRWAAVSKYGALYQSSRIVFSGVMTQMQACLQPSHRDGSCDTLDNTPAEGWSQLVDAINMDAYTVSPYPRWSTDIKWQYD